MGKVLHASFEGWILLVWTLFSIDQDSSLEKQAIKREVRPLFTKEDSNELYFVTPFPLLFLCLCFFYISFCLFGSVSSSLYRFVFFIIFFNPFFYLSVRVLHLWLV